MIDPDVITEARALMEEAESYAARLEWVLPEGGFKQITSNKADELVGCLRRIARHQKRLLAHCAAQAAQIATLTQEREGSVSDYMTTHWRQRAEQAEAQIATKDDQYQTLLANAYQLEETIRLLRIEQRADVKRWNAANTEAEAQIVTLTEWQNGIIDRLTKGKDEDSNK